MVGKVLVLWVVLVIKFYGIVFVRVEVLYGG